MRRVKIIQKIFQKLLINFILKNQE